MFPLASMSIDPKRFFGCLATPAVVLSSWCSVEFSPVGSMHRRVGSVNSRPSRGAANAASRLLGVRIPGHALATFHASIISYRYTFLDTLRVTIVLGRLWEFFSWVTLEYLCGDVWFCFNNSVLFGLLGTSNCTLKLI